MEVERYGEYKISTDQVNSLVERTKCRTDSIGIWKVLCTYMIVVLHYGYAVGWKLTVEFFFIVSGILMAYEYDTKNTGYVVYVTKRIIRLWPHYIFSFIVFMIFSLIGGGVFRAYMELKNSLLEIFMLQIIGIGDYATNHGAVWYVSALVVSSIFLYGLLRLFGADGRKINLFCAIFIIIGYCSQLIFGDMCIVTWESPLGFCLLPGLIRGISEMAIGLECYYCGKCIKARGIFEKYKKSLIIIEVLTMIVVTIYTRSNLNMHIFIIFAYALVATIAFFARHTGIINFAFNKMEKYTYAVYLNHPIILIICAGKSMYKILIIVTLYSILTTEVIGKIEKVLIKRKCV